jgi:glucoamylase
VTLALAFGRYWAEAGLRAKLSLADGFDRVAAEYADEWHAYQKPLRHFDRKTVAGHNSYRISTAVLRSHESPSFPGGFIASLSIPWGSTKGDDDLGGYHLVWPRDLVQTASALIACGASDEALRVLEYLRGIQEPEGCWPQNAWLDGLPYWRGIQLDECAFPIVLVDIAHRNGLLTNDEIGGYWPMVWRAASFLVRNGPVTGQDRWEEDAGLSTFTLAVTVTALLAAADLAETHATTDDAALLRDTADAWNACIEDWTYASGTPLAAKLGVSGYYVRIAPAEGTDHPVAIKNREASASVERADAVVSPDALALVRFGLRAANDPRVLDTIRAIDATLRIDLPQGKCWYRYNGDGYGEKPDGSPFDGTGQGRPWPLLVGERAHYELAAGNRAEAERLLATMEAFAGLGGLLPEQVWDGDDIPERELFRGHPSGSAMPLVWAHAEHIKLLRSLAEGAIFDMPPRTVQRYLRDKVAPRVTIWRPDLPIGEIIAGRVLRIDLPRAACLRWSADDWTSVHDMETTEAGIGGLFCVALPTSDLAPDGRLIFTWRWLGDGAWHGRDYEVSVMAE